MRTSTPIKIKILIETTLRWNLGTLRAIIAPKKTPIHAKLLSAKNEPNHISRGRGYNDANVMVSNWLLSPNSIIKINKYPAK